MRATSQTATGDKGQGIKIGVVDTGVDSSSPFLSADGFSYPPGFPKGDTKLTTPKVIVARVFPGPVRDANSTNPFDPTEPHGTHVSGIAAGDEGTNAPAGPDHPATANLSGVAPKAWIGNYRVFTVPTPLGHEANTPEIVHAFESAVADGMNVINFSGGGPQTDPANDAMNETVHNTALAGVVPVIAAGNDRDDFGLGTAGSPGTAPDAIAVAATSNSHVFAPALSVVGGPPSLGAVPIQSNQVPKAWTSADQTLVDVSTIVGTDGKPVDAYLCGPATDPNGGRGTIPAGSLAGKLALVQRGTCSFVSKAERAIVAGATGIILIDNRPGEANGIPALLPIPSGMISDLDGKTLRAYAAANGGQAAIRVSSGIEEISTDRSGVITSFSSAGPTDFDHRLKPDISAPGLDVLSSTPPATTGSTFSVFAGTSMATPHVAGAAALLLQRHPQWTSWQVKSALMSTAGPAWGDTARTQEASVLLEGAGLANVATADDPKIFTDPQSLSFERIDVSTGAQRDSMLLTISDAGDGAGTWTVSLAPQSATNGVTIDVPGQVTLGPGSDAAIPVVVRAAADAQIGENYGFIVLTSNGVQRRVPYGFLLQRPALRDAPVSVLQKVQVGDTNAGTSRVSVYCCPGAPFGQPPTYTGAPMNEDGSEHLYSMEINEPVVNFGVSVLASSSGALIDPFVLGSKNESDVQGYAGVPTDVNSLTFDANLDIGAAGVQFPRLQRFYIAVDSRADEFTNKSQKGKYLLNAWINDLTPPSVRVLTTRVTAGRPLIVAQAVDAQSGVDPLSLVLAYSGVLVAASAYDPASGLIVFGLPNQAPAAQGRQPVGRRRRLRLPGVEEHQHRRQPADAEHAVPLDEAEGRQRAHRVVDRAPVVGVCPAARPARRRRSVDDQGEQGRLPRRQARDRSRQDRLGRDLHRHLEDDGAEARCPAPHGHRRRQQGPRGSLRPPASRSAGSGRHRRLLGHRRRARACVASARVPRGRPLPPAVGGRRARHVRRLRPIVCRGGGCRGTRTPSSDRPARQQRGDRCPLELPRRRSRPLRGGDAGQLPRHDVDDARIPAGARRRVAPGERRLGRGHVRGRALLGVETCSARVLALDRGRAGRRAVSASSRSTRASSRRRASSSGHASDRSSPGSSSTRRSSSVACSTPSTATSARSSCRAGTARQRSRRPSRPGSSRAYGRVRTYQPSNAS